MKKIIFLVLSFAIFASYFFYKHYTSPIHVCERAIGIKMPNEVRFVSVWKADYGKIYRFVVSSTEVNKFSKEVRARIYMFESYDVLPEISYLGVELESPTELYLIDGRKHNGQQSNWLYLANPSSGDIFIAIYDE